MTEDKLILPSDITEREILSRRTEEERERDRVLVARMYVRGKSQHEMALALSEFYPNRKVSSNAVGLDLDAIRQAWLNSTLVDFNAVKAKELARLDELEKEAWEAWERSKDKHVRLEYHVADDQVPFSANAIAKVQRKSKHKVIEATVGDSKYLEMIERVIKMRCDIFGLFQAQKLQIDWRAEALQSGLTDEEIDTVKNKTVELLLEAITKGAEESGVIKQEDIIEATSEDA